MIMPNADPHQKVRPEHLKRDAYLYVRQSTLQQVLHNTESTQRQYALKQRAAALGWPIERIIVIDSDLGQSGASAVDREGFQKLVTEVGMGHVGIVLGLEVSRLARNCTDWHRLLEICGLTDTLILDEDGLYDPGHFNDRLLLGLKGTMSEAELHILRARLQGGIHNKARRGELRMLLPVGLVYDDQGRVVRDLDKQVQQALRTFFQVYQRKGSALAVVKYFSNNGLNFPWRVRGGINKGQLVWGPLGHARALQILRNPRYAGAFVFGRTRACKQPNGCVRIERLPQEQWHTLIPDAHPGYISWSQYQDNQRTLHVCAQARGSDRRKSPPGQGPALLQGLVICGACGRRMTVRYHKRHGKLTPDYMCQHESTNHGKSLCQQIPGSGIDQAIGQLLLEMVQPVTLELAMAVQTELQARAEQTDQLRRQQVERARYEAELARSRYMQIDPNHRLVADALEADWNNALRALSEAQEQYQQQRQKDQAVLDDQGRQKVLGLAQDLPRLWHDQRTCDQDRKRMVRLLIEDVTLTKGQSIRAQIRFKGGATRTLTLARPLNAWEERITSPDVIRQIDQLLDRCTDAKVAEELNRRACRSGMKLEFTSNIVARLRRTYGLKCRHDRLRERGLLTVSEMAAILGVARKTVRVWRSHGLLRSYEYNDKGERLYELPPQDQRPRKQQGLQGKLTERARQARFLSHAANEVHHEA
ncbi:MAG: recombinase family protein [Planctomycetota bacterium]|jgi:DNA invertase Pin-like site-specific DNA recombinase